LRNNILTHVKKKRKGVFAIFFAIDTKILDFAFFSQKFLEFLMGYKLPL